MPRRKVMGHSSIVLPLIFLLAALTLAAPSPQSAAPSLSSTSSYWFSSVTRQGTVAFGSDSSYQIFRNVMSFGATGDGTTDDTDAINNAISSGGRCGLGCNSSTITPAIVYFPPGTYRVSAPIIQYYYTQLVGDAVTLPTIKADPLFAGIAIIDSDPYIPNGGGANWYVNQNNFFRQVRNFVIDQTGLPATSSIAGIHWQVAQATSLQNIVFNMNEGGDGNAQQGIFMDNGSGGFMSDLVFNGGAVGAFFGNQQFTTRNLTFNNCQTAIKMNWNWLWTLKSVTITGSQIGLDMSNTGETVGSVIFMDSSISSNVGIMTTFDLSNATNTAGTLVIDNVDFTGSKMAVASNNGTTQILAGGSVIDSWAQGNAYQPSAGSLKAKRRPQSVTNTPTADTCGETSIATSTATVSPIQSTSSISNVTTTASTVLATSSSNATSYGYLPSVSGYANASSTCSAAPTPVASKHIQQQLTPPTMPSSLMDGDIIFERSKPQYESVPVSSFVSIKTKFGAKGDGVTDDTAAVQMAMNNTSTDEILYIDHGAYLISSTVYVPPNIRIVGEIWPLFMVSGTTFSDPTNPAAVFQVGVPGDTGAVEMSDLIFETQGPQPGAIIMQWNVADSQQGACGLWDVHFRIGGSAGTQLQGDTCYGNTTDTQSFNPSCAGSYLMMHITQQATCYMENSWLWVADHELDLAPNNETNIYNGRGLLIESQGPVWLYGTSVEHSQLYNYQVSNAKNIYMGAIQTETAYMQSAPDALHAGFNPNPGFNDPDFAACVDETCIKTWGLRIVDSSDVYVYGAGLYSFFDDYEQQCLLTESCQENMVDIECSSSVYLYGLNTKAATNMVVVNGQSQALQADNSNTFCQTIALFEAA